jgi:hypothetical protein
VEKNRCKGLGKWMYNPAIQVQVSRDADLGSYIFLKKLAQMPARCCGTVKIIDLKHEK